MQGGLNMMGNTILIYILMTTFSLIISVVFSEDDKPSREEGMHPCTVRTGLNEDNILDFDFKNEGCTLECSTKQGKVIASFLKEGERCKESDAYLEKSRCHLGKCKNIEEGLDYPRNFFVFKISVKKASVPKKFQKPDTMISIKVKRFGGPALRDGDLVCHTNVIKNTNKPIWENFVCETLPLNLTAVLSFTAIEYDGDNKKGDLIGVVNEQIEYLLDRGPVKLYMEGPDTRTDKAKHYIQVDVTGEKFKRPSETRKKDTGQPKVDYI